MTLAKNVRTIDLLARDARENEDSIFETSNDPTSGRIHFDDEHLYVEIQGTLYQLDRQSGEGGGFARLFAHMGA